MPRSCPSKSSRFYRRALRLSVFTPGSGNQFGEKFFQAAVEAAGRLQRRAILFTRFPQQLPLQLPSGVISCAYAPFSRLLPRTAAVIHHGGVGTMSQALAAGVPQLIMPLGPRSVRQCSASAPPGSGRLVVAGAIYRPGGCQQASGLIELLRRSRAMPDVCGQALPARRLPAHGRGARTVGLGYFRADAARKAVIASRQGSACPRKRRPSEEQKFAAGSSSGSPWTSNAATIGPKR